MFRSLPTVIALILLTVAPGLYVVPSAVDPIEAEKVLLPEHLPLFLEDP